jgi:hypothetical protein
MLLKVFIHLSFWYFRDVLNINYIHPSLYTDKVNRSQRISLSHPPETKLPNMAIPQHAFDIAML